MNFFWACNSAPRPPSCYSASLPTESNTIEHKIYSGVHAPLVENLDWLQEISKEEAVSDFFHPGLHLLILLMEFGILDSSSRLKRFPHCSLYPFIADAYLDLEKEISLLDRARKRYFRQENLPPEKKIRVSIAGFMQHLREMKGGLGWFHSVKVHGGAAHPSKEEVKRKVTDFIAWSLGKQSNSLHSALERTLENYCPSYEDVDTLFEMSADVTLESFIKWDIFLRTLSEMSEKCGEALSPHAIQSSFLTNNATVHGDGNVSQIFSLGQREHTWDILFLYGARGPVQFSKGCLSFNLFDEKGFRVDNPTLKSSYLTPLHPLFDILMQIGYLVDHAGVNRGLYPNLLKLHCKGWMTIQKLSTIAIEAYFYSCKTNHAEAWESLRLQLLLSPEGSPRLARLLCLIDSLLEYSGNIENKESKIHWLIQNCPGLPQTPQVIVLQSHPPDKALALIKFTCFFRFLGADPSCCLTIFEGEPGICWNCNPEEKPGFFSFPIRLGSWISKILELPPQDQTVLRFYREQMAGIGDMLLRKTPFIGWDAVDPFLERLIERSHPFFCDIALRLLYCLHENLPGRKDYFMTLSGWIAAAQWRKDKVESLEKFKKWVSPLLPILTLIPNGSLIDPSKLIEEVCSTREFEMLLAVDKWLTVIGKKKKRDAFAKAAASLVRAMAFIKPFLSLKMFNKHLDFILQGNLETFLQSYQEAIQHSVFPALTSRDLKEIREEWRKLEKSLSKKKKAVSIYKVKETFADLGLININGTETAFYEKTIKLDNNQSLSRHDVCDFSKFLEEKWGKLREPHKKSGTLKLLAIANVLKDPLSYLDAAHILLKLSSCCDLAAYAVCEAVKLAKTNYQKTHPVEYRTSLKKNIESMVSSPFDGDSWPQVKELLEHLEKENSIHEAIKLFLWVLEGKKSWDNTPRPTIADVFINKEAHEGPFKRDLGALQEKLREVFHIKNKKNKGCRQALLPPVAERSLKQRAIKLISASTTPSTPLRKIQARRIPHFRKRQRVYSTSIREQGNLGKCYTLILKCTIVALKILLPLALIFFPFFAILAGRELMISRNQAPTHTAVLTLSLSHKVPACVTPVPPPFPLSDVGSTVANPLYSRVDTKSLLIQNVVIERSPCGEGIVRKFKWETWQNSDPNPEIRALDYLERCVEKVQEETEDSFISSCGAPHIGFVKRGDVEQVKSRINKYRQYTGRFH